MAGAEEFARLARRLKDMGETGLRAELTRAVNDAAEPFARQVSNASYLYPYMPNRYADVLAGDERVSTLKRTGLSAYGVAVRLQGRLHRRQVQTLNRGIIRHPVFARSDLLPRQDWTWVTQTGGMKPGFFDDAIREHVPQIRDDIQAAIRRVRDKLANG